MFSDTNQTLGDIASKGPNRPLRPSEVFRVAVRNVRKRRRWTATDLAQHLAVDRSTVTKLENGKRGVSLDDAFAYAGALGVHPSSLMAPLDNTPVEVRPGEVVEGNLFRAWLRAQAFVRPDDVPYFPAEVDADQWLTRCQTSLTLIIRTTQQMLDAVEDAIDPESEAAQAAGDRLDAANAALIEFARVLAERDNPRPVSRRRVRNAA